jgi:hypothetical protein
VVVWLSAAHLPPSHYIQGVDIGNMTLVVARLAKPVCVGLLKKKGATMLTRATSDTQHVARAHI